MIPAVIIWLLKRYASKRVLSKMEQFVYYTKQKSLYPLLSCLFLFLPMYGWAQESSTTYTILHHGKVIGSMQGSRNAVGDDVFLKLTSSVQTRFVFEVQVSTLDRAHLKGGRLISSSVCRTVNGKEKPAKRTKLMNDSYQLETGKKLGYIREEITYTMAMMYFQEPIQIDRVYSDNFQQFLHIKKIGQNRYRIDLPDGNFNE